MNMKHALAAMVLAGVFGSAQAATVSLTGADFPFSLGTDPTNANAYSVSHNPGSFTDVYNFTLSKASDTVSSAVSLFLPGLQGGAATWNITNGTLSLFNSSNAQLASTTWGSTDGVLAVSNVAAGNYYWKVSGNAVGLNGGVYLYSADTAPVPEPGTYAMMLIGLGLLGFIAKRQLGQMPAMGSMGMA